jgi:AmiR/NasT family two-component response regulator
MNSTGGDESRAVATQEDIRRALETWSPVGQAMGVLMERLSIDADEAFDMLR